MTSHMPITATTWVAVFDGGRSAVFENEGFDDAPNLRRLFGRTDDNPRAHEQGSDRAGRYATPTGGRAATEITDFHDQREGQFVDALADEIESAARLGKFDRLVLIAPARLARRVRERAPQAAGKVVGERAGDFAHMPIEQIERAFKEAVRTPA